MARIGAIRKIATTTAKTASAQPVSRSIGVSGMWFCDIRVSPPQASRRP